MPAVAWAVVIFILSSIPGDELPDEPFDMFDKLVHAVIFGVLCLLIYRAFQFQNFNRFLKEFSILVAFMFIIAYGILDEYHQKFIPGRYPDPADALADVIGGGFASIGIFLKQRKKT